MSYIPIETAIDHLDKLLEAMSLGETVTLVDQNGQPTALLVSLKTQEAQKANVESDATLANRWFEQLDALTARIGPSWMGGVDAVVAIADVRQSGDYLQWRDEMFGQETVATLYPKVAEFQKMQPRP